MKDIKRYLVSGSEFEVTQHPDGDYVEFDDHSAILAALQEESDSNLKSTQYSAETNRKIVKNNIEPHDAIAVLQEQVRGLKERLQLVAELNDVASALHVEAEKKVWALAAEGSAIKQAFKQAANTVEEYEIYGDLKYAVEPSEYEALADAIEETPATDAALREIRAQAVEGFLSIISHTKDMLYADSVKSSLSDYACRIRSGEQP